MNIKEVAVIGSGIMGSGIAQVVLQAGFPVRLYDISEASLQKGTDYIKRNLAKAVSKGKYTQEQADRFMAALSTTTDLNGLADVDAVFEVVFERMDVKKELFGKLKDIVKPEALFISNTSGLSITEMASASGRADRVVGMHFFNPVPVMKLVEIIRGYYTSDETVNAARELAAAIGKEAILAKESPLFVVNRILIPMLNEAAFVYQEGIASREDIDTGMKLGANMPIGPLALCDLIGLDTLLLVMETLYNETRDSKYRPATIFTQLVRAGRYGRKNGHGFYDYEQAT